MNVLNRIRYLCLGAATAFLLAACAGGVGNDMVAGGGLTGTGITQGTVTGIGSIHVNGVRYVTDTATFERDGASASISEFEVGEIVSVRWNLDDDGSTRNAALVFYESEIKGVVTGAPDLVNNTIEILGQQVQITGSTAFKGSGVTQLGDLAAGDYVELNAFQQSYDANPSIPPLRATVIERITPEPSEVELKGVVNTVNSGASSLTIGAMTVYWISVPDGEPVTDDYVKVEGTYSAGDIVNATVTIADRGIEIEAAEEDEAELEGVVTQLTDQTTFEVNGQPVVTATNVTYEPAGLTLAVGDRVEVEGSINAFGDLVAETIEARDEGDIEIEGDIEAIDGTNLSVTILGIEVFTDELTQFDDESSLELQSFDFSDLGIGDHLEIRASRESDSGPVVATRLVRRDGSAEIVLEGLVESKTSTVITILGVDIDVTAASEWYAADGSPLTSSEFLDQVVAGTTIVDASGNQGSSWTKLEIED